MAKQDTQRDNEFRKGAKNHSAFLVSDGSEKVVLFYVGPKGLFVLASKGLRGETIFQHEWAAIDEIEVDGADALQKRVTATRLLAVGIFAFALKKKSGDVYVYVSSGNTNYLFRLPKLSAPDARALFAPYKNQIGAISRSRESLQGIAEENRIQAAENAGPRVRCIQCSRMVSATETFCELCGYRLPVGVLVAPPESDLINCPFCAEDIKKEAIKCKHCGEFLDAREGSN